MSEDEALIAEIVIGEDAKRFVESELGKVVLGMAQQEVEAAREQLESVNPTDIQAIESLQQQARFGRQFNTWLCELITKGEAALNVYRQQQQES